MYNQWKGVQPRTAFVVYFVFRWVLKALIFKERFKGSKCSHIKSSIGFKTRLTINSELLNFSHIKTYIRFEDLLTINKEIQNFDHIKTYIRLEDLLTINKELQNFSHIKTFIRFEDLLTINKELPNFSHIKISIRTSAISKPVLGLKPAHYQQRAAKLQ